MENPRAFRLVPILDEFEIHEVICGREGEKILSFTRDPRANPVAKAGSLSP